MLQRVNFGYVILSLCSNAIAVSAVITLTGALFPLLARSTPNDDAFDSGIATVFFYFNKQAIPGTTNAVDALLPYEMTIGEGPHFFVLASKHPIGHLESYVSPAPTFNRKQNDFASLLSA